MFAGQTPLLSPVERASGAMIAQLMQRFDEMCRSPNPPTAERLLRWTLAVGKNPEWVDVNAQALRYRAKAGLPVTPEEFETWRYSAQAEILRPCRSGESLTDQYERFRRLYPSEFPVYPTEPFWRWRIDSVRPLLYAGNDALIYGPKGSGKTGGVIVIKEILEDLKDDQVGNGRNSILAQIAGHVHGDGGSPLHPRKPGSPDRGIYYATGWAFVANFTIKERPGSASPNSRLHTEMELSSFLLRTCEALLEGREVMWLIDEAGVVAVDKFVTGSARMKSLGGIQRLARKYHTRITWNSQHGPGDFTQDFIQSAETRWSMFPPKRDRAQGKATITVPGSPLQERIVTGIPEPRAWFNTDEKPTLVIDIIIKDLLDRTARIKQKAIDAGREWTDEEDITTTMAEIRDMQREAARLGPVPRNVAPA